MKTMERNKNISGSIIITGGGKRLGSMIAEMFASQGWQIFLHYNNSENEAQNLKKKILREGGKVELIKKELHDNNSVKEIIDFAMQKSFKCGFLSGYAFKYSPFFSSHSSYVFVLLYPLFDRISCNCYENLIRLTFS